MAKKRLYRSRDNRIFGGIFGGLDDYFGVDASLLRLAWLLVLVFTVFMPGMLAYIIAWMIIPLEPKDRPKNKE